MNAPWVDVHTHHFSPSGTVAIYAYDPLEGGPLPDTPYSTGCHPWKIGTRKSDSMQSLLRSSVTPKTVAIGEIGLDYLVANSIPQRQQQEAALRWQMGIAVQYRLPVIIHCVKAYDPLMRILKDASVPILIHGFCGSSQQADQLLDKGYYLSFGRQLFRSTKTRTALGMVPADRLFLESDTEPATFLPQLYEQAASIRQVTTEALRQTIFENYNRIFKR